MAKTYDRPLISFFLEEPGPPTDTLPDFRLAQSNKRPWSPELHKEFHRVAGQREIVLDLATLAEVQPIPIIELRLQLEDDPEESALLVLQWLFGSAPLSIPRPSLGEWISLIEEKGVLVTQISGVKVHEMRAFSIGLHPLPVIALNGADSGSARLFSLIHELVHILLRGSALCDLQGPVVKRGGSMRNVEWFCNAVAAAVLIPHELLLQRVRVARPARESQWQLRQLQGLASEFGVSAEAMLLRLITVEQASPGSYARMKPLFDKFANPNSKGFLLYYPGKIRNLGRRYISTVLAAYDQGAITDATMARYLDIKLQNIPKLIDSFEPRT